VYEVVQEGGVWKVKARTSAPTQPAPSASAAPSAAPSALPEH